MNHISGKRAGVAGTFNTAEKLEERRAALDVWAEFLRRVTERLMSDDEVRALRRTLRRQYWNAVLGDEADMQRPALLKAA